MWVQMVAKKNLKLFSMWMPSQQKTSSWNEVTPEPVPIATDSIMRSKNLVRSQSLKTIPISCLKLLPSSLACIHHQKVLHICLTGRTALKSHYVLQTWYLSCNRVKDKESLWLTAALFATERTELSIPTKMRKHSEQKERKSSEMEPQGKKKTMVCFFSQQPS